MWRCGGCLHHATQPAATKHPIILSWAHHFTTLVIRTVHSKMYHNGVKETLSEVRARFLVVKGRI